MEEVDISAESICRSEILAQHRQRSSVRLTMGLSLTWRYYLLHPEFGAGLPPQQMARTQVIRSTSSFQPWRPCYLFVYQSQRDLPLPHVEYCLLCMSAGRVSWRPGNCG